jgi:hypothetical protein
MTTIDKDDTCSKCGRIVGEHTVIELLRCQGRKPGT